MTTGPIVSSAGRFGWSPSTFSGSSALPQPRQLARTSDSDTPVIDQPVRMVSVDTPEKQHYAGLPPTAQAKLDRCRQRLQDGTYAA